jgi:hypothetical protein
VLSALRGVNSITEDDPSGRAQAHSLSSVLL